MKRYILSILIVCLPVFAMRIPAATMLGDNASASILTCDPGDEIYELFGHSGIRIKDTLNDIDIVFHYGLFDFNQEDFIWRFVKGETDYQMGWERFRSFCADYRSRGSAVYETHLDLSREEVQKLWDYLNWNYQPENREYRYNYFFDNCATRIRDLVEYSKDCDMQYARIERMTFRDVVRECTVNSPWSQFGFDLCLGMGMDTLATARQMMFMPKYVGFTTSFCDSIPVTTAVEQILPDTMVPTRTAIGPDLTFWLILIITIILTVIGLQKGYRMRWLNAIIFTIDGLFGIVIAFLVFISVHPFTEWNFILLWMNPLMLIAPIVSIKPLRKGEKPFYLTTAVLTAIFVFTWPFSPQEYNSAVLPIVLTLLVRSTFMLIPYRNESQA